MQIVDTVLTDTVLTDTVLTDTVLTDTHCHLDLDAFRGDRGEVLARAWDAGVGCILTPGLDLASSRDAVHLAETPPLGAAASPGVAPPGMAAPSKAETSPLLFAAVGVHPNSARTWRESISDGGTQDALRELATHPPVVAIGEIGLDYYRHHSPHDLQRRVFKQQLELALEVELPVVLHVRNASESDRACIIDLLKIIEPWHKRAIQKCPALRGRLGVVHSFSGNLDEANKIISLGFYLGITGPVTYKKAANLRKVVASVPLERLLLETDAPFLTPHPHRGKRNEPAYVKYIAEKISEVRDLPLNEVARVTTENAEILFRWSM